MLLVDSGSFRVARDSQTMAFSPASCCASVWNAGMPESLLSLRVLPNRPGYFAREYLSSPILHLVRRGVGPRPHARPGRPDARGSNGNETQPGCIDLDLRQH